MLATNAPAECRSMVCFRLETFIVCIKEYLFLLLRCVGVGKYPPVSAPCKCAKCMLVMQILAPTWPQDPQEQQKWTQHAFLARLWSSEHLSHYHGSIWFSTHIDSIMVLLIHFGRRLRGTRKLFFFWWISCTYSYVWIPGLISTHLMLLYDALSEPDYFISLTLIPGQPRPFSSCSTPAEQ